MSIGGFSAMVRMTSHKTRIGFGDTGTFRGDAQMEMEGTLLECEYRDLAARLSHGIKTFVSVDIEFTEDPDWAGHVDVYTNDGDRYLGTLQLRDRVYDKNSFSETDTTEVRAHVSILLPITALHSLIPLTGYVYRLDTVHDLIDDPTDAGAVRKVDEEDQGELEFFRRARRTDHVIAFVKRICLEPVLESPVQR